MQSERAIATRCCWPPEDGDAGGNPALHVEHAPPRQKRAAVEVLQGSLLGEFQRPALEVRDQSRQEFIRLEGQWPEFAIVLDRNDVIVPGQR
ncbi:hypothetical protein [Bosea beijingensis]|uniref:hypothetical protein n=1 Tax=Bosea beijingensis TaxID=3068632 RepID=UPI0027428EC1|nr:hypothetical protein [Bosea sp. REN20]